MTIQSTWRQVFMGAKLGLGAAVVAGVMAFSVTGHAATLSGSPNTILSGSPLPGTGSAALDFTGLNGLSVGDGWNITLSTIQGGGTEADPFFNYVGFQSTEYLITISTTVQNPETTFQNAQAGWAPDNSGSTGTFFSVPGSSDLKLTTTFALNEIKYLVFRWWGALTPTVARGASTLNTTLNAVVPLPAGLVLFLSGLVGIGFLGRFKAKRRETTVV